MEGDKAGEILLHVHIIIVEVLFSSEGTVCSIPLSMRVSKMYSDTILDNTQYLYMFSFI